MKPHYPTVATSAPCPRSSHYSRCAGRSKGGCSPTKPGWAVVRSVSIVPLLGVFLLLVGSGQVRADEKTLKEKNVLIIGRSSLRPPLHDLVEAFLASNKTPMNVEQGPFGAKALDHMLGSRVWDYVIMDAWQFKQGRTDPPEFPDAVTAFVKQVRAHSPQCKIILFPWWIPAGPDATNDGVLKVFQRCVEASRQNGIWVTTTGPAFGSPAGTT